ncbi:hypothetical protein [Psychroserpens ponticola]|uniref:OmpH family outer membrane protein n=1 Tax=Psychroserpens ponticola TaxID=2932268 RepID=A0ABY7RZN5_9FLAO|nr:hypothetical protein [Psychroserpens ponticola]WCO02207.1 hypothetical protein MUN68_001660 [Psychroserpens ponticola]
MKKLITLCFFSFALLFSTQGLDAQNKLEINAAASEKAKEIRKTIKIDKNQLEEVYQAYKTYETTYQKISSDLESNQQKLEKINTILDTKLKSILTEAQFEKYIAIYRTDE